MTYLEQYWDLIRNNEIVVGYWVRKETENLIQDLQNPNYIYDTTEANKRISFIEHCCFQGKEPYYMKTPVLMPWQKMFFEVIYSFKLKDTGFRRFNDVLLVVSRKNTKSTTLAADGLYDLFCGAGGQDICTASSDDKTAKLIFDELGGMAQRLDPKGQMVSRNLVEIRNNLKNIKVSRLSSKMQNMDGRNFSKCYYDEAHSCNEENGQSEVAESLWRSMSTKDEPLFICCSTMGFNRDAYLDKRIEMAKAVIEGEINNPHFFPLLYVQDSEQEIWRNEASWEKSNPALRYGIKKISKLRQDVETAKYDAGSRIHMLVKDFGIAQNSAKAWLNLEDYDYPQEKWTLEDFRNCFCLAAVDLAETTDLTVCNLLFMRQNDNTKYIYSHGWIPEIKLQKSDDKTAGADYKQWIKSGYMSVCDGADNDVTVVADWLGELKQQYGIRVLMCYYDQRFAKPFVARLEDIGIESEVIAQSKYVLSSPIKLMENDLKYHIINYNNNPVMKWCLSNASLDVDNAGRVLIVKQRGQHEKRIDAAVACAILLAGYQRIRADFDRVLK